MRCFSLMILCLVFIATGHRTPNINKQWIFQFDLNKLYLESSACTTTIPVIFKILCIHWDDKEEGFLFTLQQAAGDRRRLMYMTEEYQQNCYWYNDIRGCAHIHPSDQNIMTVSVGVNDYFDSKYNDYSDAYLYQYDQYDQYELWQQYMYWKQYVANLYNLYDSDDRDEMRERTESENEFGISESDIIERAEQIARKNVEKRLEQKLESRLEKEMMTKLDSGITSMLRRKAATSFDQDDDEEDDDNNNHYDEDIDEQHHGIPADEQNDGTKEEHDVNDMPPHDSLNSNSSNEEIDLTEILHEIPEMKSNNSSIPSPLVSPSITSNTNTANANGSNDNVITLALKVIFALLVTQLQKLPISSRIIHQFLILHFLLSMINLSQYLMLCAPSIINHYQYWRFLTYNFSDTNAFMALIACITLSDIIKRMEYYFGSLWTLYLFLTNWLFLSLFTFIVQYIEYMTVKSMLNHLQCQCIGLYPMIFSLWIIEIMLSLPSMQYHIFGIIYMKQIYHPIVYCVLYNIFIRFDVATVIAITYSSIFLYCFPSIFHLSRYRIQKIQNSKWLQCILNDKLFISIENIDYDCFIATGKYISAKSDKNTDLLLPDMDHTNQMIDVCTEDNGCAAAVYGVYDNSDREDLPFIISPMPVNRKRG